MEVHLFDSSDQSLEFIKTQFQEDITWHREDVANKVRKKKYGWQFKSAVTEHLLRFQGYFEVSQITGMDVKILKQWVYMSRLKQRCELNSGFQLLKIDYRSSLHAFSRESHDV